MRRLALSLADVEEIDSDGFDFRVGNKGFVWSYPERLPGPKRVIRTDIAVLFVGDEAEKQAPPASRSPWPCAPTDPGRPADPRTRLLERVLSELP